MLPVRLLLAGLLTLDGVHAKIKDRVDVSKFAGGECGGHPIGSRFEVKKDKCMSFQAGSLWIHPHHKPKYNNWIDQVNDGKVECFVSVYKSAGCVKSEYITDIYVPRHFEMCTKMSKENEGISSIMFHCTPHSSWQGIPRNESLELRVTSYSIGSDGIAHPSVYTTDITATRHSYEPHAARAEPTDHPTLEPRRKKHNILGVWMKHPWVHSDICYMCWTKKEYDFGKFYCRSGPKYPVYCGPNPKHVPLISAYTVTSTSTTEFYFTTTNQFAAGRTAREPTPTVSVEKRSSHTPVVLAHPYQPGLAVCADAEWENEDKEKAEVRIQHVEKYDKCRNKDALPIGINRPLHIASHTTTLATRPTWAPPRA